MVFVALQFDYFMTSHIILRRRKPMVILGSLLNQRASLPIPLVFTIIFHLIAQQTRQLIDASIHSRTVVEFVERLNGRRRWRPRESAETHIGSEVNREWPLAFVFSEW
jgi:hypothetical protein